MTHPTMALLGLTSGDAALLISLASLAVSFGSLSWQLYLALRVDAARLDVEITPMIPIGVDVRPEPVLLISVTNVGKRPTQLNALWLQTGRPFRRRHRLVPKRWRGKGSFMLYDTEGPVPPPNLPCRLDVGEVVSVGYRTSLVKKRVQENNVKWLFGAAYASTAKGFSGRLSTTDLGG